MDKSGGRVLLITGVSTGFGRALSEAALLAGHTVIGTVRNEAAKAEFDKLDEKRAHGAILDVTDFAAIETIVKDVTARTGPVDVLVNNAGYGHEGTLEESPLDELIRQFNVNVFGAVAMTKAVLPSMRVRRRGHILNITSMGGYITMPGIAEMSRCG